MRLFPLALLALAVACDAPEAPAPVAVGSLPEEACGQVDDGLKKLGEAALFEYNAKGEATVADEAWLAMSQSDREQLARTLAIHAACQIETPPSEQKVVIRNEGGRVLTEQLVETGVDIGRLIQD